MKSATLRAFYATLVLASIGLTPLRGWSQVSSGSILGTVADSSGAVIPGVSIKVTNSSVGLSRETISNESGNYRVDQLPIGLYTVEAELVGFKREVHANIKIDIDQRIRVDISLQPGQVNEVVEVSAAAPVIQTEDSSIGQVIDERKIRTLPLNGRDFWQLAFIVPGAFAVRPGSTLTGRGGFAIAGQNDATNQFLLDGVNNNGTSTLEIAARINVDTVGEFKVQTGTYGAQYGRYAGAQVDVVTKSGTNTFHGNAFGFFRNDNLDARNFFDPYPLKNLPEFKRLQYGATIGGPIVKEKLFFFAGYQGQRQSRFITTAPNVPLPEFFTGDLSKMTQIARDPLTGQPFPGNIIPGSRLNPVALRFQRFWPTPTRPGLTQNASSLLPSPDNFNQPNGKIDWAVSPNHRFYGSYQFYDNKLFEWVIAGNPEVPGFMTDSRIKSQGLSLGEVWTISPTTVNEFRAGMGRLRRVRQPENRTINYNEVLGIPGTTADTDKIAWGTPYLLVTGFARLGDNTNMPQPRVDQTFTITDTVSIIRGNHALKIGGDFFRQENNIVFVSTGRGRFDFSGQITGNAFADFLLGLPTVTQRQPPLGPLSSHPRMQSYSTYFQDDWKVARSLTLNLGVRYEYNSPLFEKFDRLSSFDPNLNGGNGGMRLVGDKARYDDAAARYRRIYPTMFIQKGGTLTKPDRNNWAPRFGFAYSPSARTVIRGGYGIFYQIESLCFCDYYQNPPFNLAERFTNVDGVTLSNPWGVSGGSSTTLAGLDYNLASPYYQHASLDIQRELPGGVIFDVTYQLKKGTKLNRVRDINQPLDRSTAAAATRRPFPQFGRTTFRENSASSIYHGLHTRVEKRTNNGSSFLMSYIWGKLLDDQSNAPQDSYNLRLERGHSMDHVAHRFSFSYVYPLPFGDGQRFGSSSSGIAKALLSQWELSGIARANTGSPYMVALSTNTSRTGNTWDRPNGVGEPNKKDGNAKSWWNRDAFVTQPAGTFGTAGRNTLIGPGAVQIDASLLKVVKLAESKELQLRFEMFNVLNHANLNAPTATIGANFGVISSTISPNRELQFGLKYLF